MSWRKTIILGLVLVVLAGVYFWDHQRVARQKAEEEEQKKLFPWRLEEVTEVVLQRPAGTVRLARDERNEWVLREPVSARADQEEARRLVEGLLRGRRDRKIAEEPPDLEVYGLNRPEYLVTVRGKSAEGERVLLLGSKNPTEVYYYARLQGGKEVFLVSDTLRRDADKPLVELRDKTVLSFDTNRVQALTIAGDGQEVTVEREAEKQWRIVGPQGRVADGDAIQSLLFRLSRLRAVAFHDTPEKSMAEMGLDPPERKLVVRLKDPEEQRVLIIGREAPSGSTEVKKPRLWAKVEGDFPVVEVESSQVGEIPLGEDGWRSKTLISFEREKVERVELVRGDGTLALRKVGQNQWEIEGPERLPADPVKVSDLLWTLKDGRVSRFPTGEEAKGASLEKPLLLARVWLQGQDRPLEAIVGGTTQDGQGNYARVPAQEETVVVAREFVEGLQKITAWELREKRFVNFDVSKVERILIKWEGREVELLRKGEGSWQLQREEVEAYRVTSLLWTVREARFEEILAERPGDAQIGREAPKFQVEVFGDGRELLGRFSIGAEVPGRQGARYAWGDPQGQIYVVGSKLLQEIARDLKTISPSLVEGASRSGG